MSDQPITEEQARAFASHPKVIEQHVKEIIRTRIHSLNRFMDEMVSSLERAKEIRLHEGQSDEIDAHIELMTTLIEVLNEVTETPIPTIEEVTARHQDHSCEECDCDCGCGG